MTRIPPTDDQTLMPLPRVTPWHCGAPMRWRRDGATWKEDTEHREREWSCTSCPTSVTIAVAEHSPRSPEQIAAETARALAHQARCAL